MSLRSAPGAAGEVMKMANRPCRTARVFCCGSCLGRDAGRGRRLDRWGSSRTGACGHGTEHQGQDRRGDGVSHGHSFPLGDQVQATVAGGALLLVKLPVKPTVTVAPGPTEPL
jgi:hypothetical protein